MSLETAQLVYMLLKQLQFLVLEQNGLHLLQKVLLANIKVGQKFFIF